jgi:ABC-2 type transport system permease protein
MDIQQKYIEVETLQDDLNRKMDAAMDHINKEKKKKIDRAETDLNKAKWRCERTYKILAITVPPIPPLFVAILVFTFRRRREREGVAASRLR